jgi:hypothetical protein
MEDGEVVSVEQFTGGDESPWWNDTWAVLVRGKSGVIVYGEISSKVEVGQWVSAGDTIGVVSTSVLKKFKGRPMVMLHMELMTHDSCDHLRDPNASDVRGGTLWWKGDQRMPKQLLDVTPLLMHAAAEECKRLGSNRPPEEFDIRTYKCHRFLNLPRFPKAKTKQEALVYYRNRATQLLKFGWSWDGAWKEFDWGVQVQLVSPEGWNYYSVYVLEPGKGHLTQWFKDNPDKKFVTSSDCKEMVSYLSSKKHLHRVIDTWYSNEYYAITKHYGERRANRSGVHMMNHIEEGIFILQQIGASPAAINAFCLHPILQPDEDIVNVGENDWNAWDVKAIALAMEYRHIANAHLPKHEGVFDLSPLKEVNQMLIADKIQNCKDFELHLAGRPDVPNTYRLSDYFYNEWFPKLGINSNQFRTILNTMASRTGQYFRCDWNGPIPNIRGNF